jgi:hypothetical protein
MHHELAARVFALEAQGAVSAEDCAAAAARVYQKLFVRLASLVGAAGARALFARSLKLTAIEFPFLGTVDHAKAGDGEAFVRPMREETPAVVTEATVALCATLFSLLETLIGQRLTANVVGSAWPELDATNQEIK